MMEIRPFSEGDRYSFSDLTGSGVEPFVASGILRGPGWTQQDLDDQWASIVVGSIGVTVVAAESIWQNRCGYEAGLKLVAEMPVAVMVEDLKQRGFIQIA